MHRPTEDSSRRGARNRKPDWFPKNLDRKINPYKLVSGITSQFETAENSGVDLTDEELRQLQEETAELFKQYLLDLAHEVGVGRTFIRRAYEDELALRSDQHPIENTLIFDGERIGVFAYDHHTRSFGSVWGVKVKKTSGRSYLELDMDTSIPFVDAVACLRQSVKLTGIDPEGGFDSKRFSVLVRNLEKIGIALSEKGSRSLRLKAMPFRQKTSVARRQKKMAMIGTCSTSRHSKQPSPESAARPRDVKNEVEESQSSPSRKRVRAKQKAEVVTTPGAKGTDLDLEDVLLLASKLNEHCGITNDDPVTGIMELLTFSSANELSLMQAEFNKTVHRGVNLASDVELVFKYGAPAIGRFLKSLRIDVENPRMFMLNFGRALALVVNELPDDSRFEVDIMELKDRYKTLSHFLGFCREHTNTLNGNSIEKLFQDWSSTNKDKRASLKYELNTLLNRKADGVHTWKVSGSSVMRLAKSQGLLSLGEPLSFLETVFKLASEEDFSGFILSSDLDSRVELAQSVVDSIFFGKNLEQTLFSDLNIASGETVGE